MSLYLTSGFPRYIANSHELDIECTSVQLNHFKSLKFGHIKRIHGAAIFIWQRVCVLN